MSREGDSDAKKKGMRLGLIFVGLFISFYALLFIGLLWISSIGNAAKGTNVISAIDTLQNPITFIISLVTIGIIMPLYFPQKSSNGKDS